jgi:signal transduction histidine kinase
MHSSTALADDLLNPVRTGDPIDRWSVGRVEEIATAVVAERTRTRAWLHDTVLQTLEYIAAGGYRDDPDPARLMHVAAEAADELRRVVEGEPIAIPGGLVEGLRRVIAAEGARADHSIRLHVIGDDGSGAADSGSEALVAAVAELLTNARKHAAPRHVVVAPEIRAGGMSVEVSDDGVGFDVHAAARGFGLRTSVAARIAEHGGETEIRSRPGAGTRVRLTLGRPPR